MASSFGLVLASFTGFVNYFVPSGRIQNERIFDIAMDMAKSLLEIDEQEVTIGTDFVFVMDNYFSLPKVVDKTELEGVGVGCIGSARARKGWPPKPIAEVNDKRFHTLYHYENDNDILIFHCMDSNVVMMVPMIHSGE